MIYHKMITLFGIKNLGEITSTLHNKGKKMLEFYMMKLVRVYIEDRVIHSSSKDVT